MLIFLCYDMKRNVLEDGFSQAIVLPSSQRHDSVLCTCVADLNWDGLNELVLGTFGRVSDLLTYM